MTLHGAERGSGGLSTVPPAPASCVQGAHRGGAKATEEGVLASGESRDEIAMRLRRWSLHANQAPCMHINASGFILGEAAGPHSVYVIHDPDLHVLFFPPNMSHARLYTALQKKH